MTALRVDGDHAVDLTGQTERSDVAGRHPASLEQGGYDGPERPEPTFRVLFSPSGVRERELVSGGGPRDGDPVGVDQHTLEALRAYVAPDHVCHTLPP